MTERLKRIAFGTIGAIALLVAAGVTACDKVPLLAPSGSTINLSASTRTLPINGSTGLTAFVTESSGTPVQNGTTVRFTTTLGTVDPVETQTTNGLAVANFLAGTLSGLAEIHAISGGAGGATGTGTSTGATSAANVITIAIGAAAVKAVTLRASPSTIGPNGGDVQIVATVVDANGAGLVGVPVTFSSDKGFLNPGTATTDASGQAVTTLTASETTVVSAFAGAVAANPTLTVGLRAGPALTLTCAPAVGSATNCAAVPADSNNTATVIFTITKPTTSSSLRDVTLNFGDGTSQSVGTLSGGTATVSHTYNGPSGTSPAAYTAVARAIDVNGEATTASANVNVTARAPVTVLLAAAPTAGRNVNFTATVTGGTAQIYAWDFDADGTIDATTNVNTTNHVYGGTGAMTATVTVTTTDGRTGTGRVEFTVIN